MLVQEEVGHQAGMTSFTYYLAQQMTVHTLEYEIISRQLDPQLLKENQAEVAQDQPLGHLETIPDQLLQEQDEQCVIGLGADPVAIDHSEGNSGIR